MNVAYDAVGAQAGQGKFSLQKGQMEFLRVWYADRCYGYPMRALPGLTQRKPWSNEPWSEDMALRAVYESVKTIRRRLLSDTKALDRAWVFIRHQWCALHSLPDAVCWVPSERGGLGLEPPPDAADYVLSAPMARAKIAGVTVENQLPWRAQRVAEYGIERYKVRLPEAECAKIASDELLATVSSDNVPDVARLVRDGWLKAVKKQKTSVRRQPFSPHLYAAEVDLNAYGYLQIEQLQQRLSAACPLFGSHRDVEAARKDYERYGSGLTFIRWLELHFPALRESMRRFHRSWHRSEVLDYLGGRIPFGLRRLHPGMTNVMSALLAVRLQPSRRVPRAMIPWLAKVSEEEVYNCEINRKIYVH